MIQQLTHSDWQRFKTIRLTALKESPEAFGSSFQKESTFDEETWIQRLSRTDVTNFVASDDTTDLGLITLAPYDDHAGLFAMWVSPAAREKGIGSKLVETVINRARSKGFQKLILDVNVNNSPAIALYKSKGFITCPQRTHTTEQQMELFL